MEKVVIFGANSFIGLNLVSDLSETNLFDIDALDLNFDKPIWNDLAAKPNVNQYKVNIFEPETYQKLSIWKDADHIISLVSTSKSATYDQTPYEEIFRNLVPYAEFLKFLQPFYKGHFVFFSSGGTVYGPAQESIPIPETYRCEPISAYGMGKRMIELLLTRTAGVSKFEYTILRLSNPLGRFQELVNEQGIFPALMKAIEEDRVFTLFGDGETIRDYFDAEEISTGLIKLFNTPSSRNQIYNFGSGEGTSVNRIIDIIERATNKKVKIQKAPIREFDVRYNVLDCQKLENVIGWKPDGDITKALLKFLPISRFAVKTDKRNNYD